MKLQPKPRDWKRYSEVNKEDFKYLLMLHKYAMDKALWFDIEYSEPEDCWEVEMNGSGEGEHFFSGKRIAYLADAIANTIKEAEKYYNKK